MRKSQDFPFFDRQVGTTGAIRGFDSLDDAEISAADRNNRAKEMGLKARYEAVTNPNPGS